MMDLGIIWHLVAALGGPFGKEGFFNVPVAQIFRQWPDNILLVCTAKDNGDRVARTTELPPDVRFAQPQAGLSKDFVVVGHLCDLLIVIHTPGCETILPRIYFTALPSVMTALIFRRRCTNSPFKLHISVRHIQYFGRSEPGKRGSHPPDRWLNLD
jgi:hypothetical protein